MITVPEGAMHHLPMFRKHSSAGYSSGFMSAVANISANIQTPSEIKCLPSLQAVYWGVGNVGQASARPHAGPVPFLEEFSFFTKTPFT